MTTVVRVGCRKSALAIKQAEIVMDAIKQSTPEIELRLITVTTKGDRILDRSLDKIGGKGLFVKELEQALHDMRIDIAVHSYKDMPYGEADGLPVVALSKRESPFDALVLPRGATAVDVAKPVGSSSLRRSLQFAVLQGGFSVAPVRGNVLTRLEKLDSGEFSALILAEAGLNRLGLGDRVSRVFTPEEILPSACQGILAVQGRAGEDYSMLAGFHSMESEYAAKAERRFTETLGGGCSAPVAAYCEVSGNELRLTGLVADVGRIDRATVSGGVEDAQRLGERLGMLLSGRR